MANFVPKGSITLERSQRSVFVGNIPYDVTEDQVRQIFSKVGPIVHLRLVHDRETGRPKGFGFCEFPDIPTAEAAIRNFNGYELGGRPLRVDSAASSDRNVEERRIQEAQQLQAAAQAAKEPLARPAEESPYGKEPEPGKAPEAIAKVVSAMPPEQMFELMKQMKQNVISNPAQTRRLLMENPQLAYALLQAQVVMRVVDPKVAYSMLHREVPATQQPFHQQQQPPVSSANGAALPIPPPQSGTQFRPQGPPPPQNMPFNAPPPAHTGFPPAGPPPGFGGPRFGGSMPMPPAATSGLNPSISSQLQSGGASNSADDEKTQAEMLLKVINLTDEQINLLPAEDRAKVLELRNQLRQRISTNPNA